MSKIEMIIRPYENADRSAVISLWQRCELTRPWNDPTRDIARKLKVNSEWFLMGSIDGKLIATVMAGYEGHRGWINYLAVDPDYRRHGLGRMLMAEVERMLWQAGCPKINLQVRPENTAAVGFYQRLGFDVYQAINLGKRLEEDGPAR